jgi:vacuolar-type H+-ATPase subunit I/STV1
MARKHSTLHSIINELVDRTNTDTQRIRVLEQREGSLSARMNSTEGEILNINKSLQKLASDLETGLKKRDAATSELKSTVKEMLKHLKQLASVSKVKELEAMLDIYNPLKSNFVTKEEVGRLITERLSRPSKNNK